MAIIYNETTKEFHLYNPYISYVMEVMENGQLGQLYFGKRIRHRESFHHLHEEAGRPMNPYPDEEHPYFSLAYLKQEYPSFGSGDYRRPAFEIRQENGSRITDFKVVSHKIYKGKPALSGLPATYAEDEGEADTLEIVLLDRLIQAEITLIYTIFSSEGAVARSVRFENHGPQRLMLEQAMSLCLDLPDHDYEWLQFSGAWARERGRITRKLEMGIQSVESARGNSSSQENPFIMLKRGSADEFQGTAIGVSFVYSGNFLAQAEVEAYGSARIMMGINPRTFSWELAPGGTFQTPEAALVFSDQGLNGVSQTYHRLYRDRLCRGYWRDRERPVLVNSWEGTYFNFDQDKILSMARAAREQGIELFVLDDGWFGERDSDSRGLGDWRVNREKLPDGLSGLSGKIKELGMEFGLWIEPEMVNEDSDLYRNHPDWVLSVPGRNKTLTRHQMVLDFSRKEVVDEVYDQIWPLLEEAGVSYVKWDMNRCITECYSPSLPPERQGEVYHRYILGLYDLYQRLIDRFPRILFESCASGGARFDPGMLFYAPQAWTSDNTDAVERIKIQYGTSYGYPVGSMAAHVSASPNHQMGRVTPLKTRFQVSCFGVFGYELDFSDLTTEELEAVRAQTAWVKQYRSLMQRGTYYRLLDPFSGNLAAWMVVSGDRTEAVVGYYRVLNEVNGPFQRLYLRGLEESMEYRIEGRDGLYWGDELMNAGLTVKDSSCGERDGEEWDVCGDFSSSIFVITGVKS